MLTSAVDRYKVDKHLSINEYSRPKVTTPAVHLKLQVKYFFIVVNVIFSIHGVLLHYLTDSLSCCYST